jgi:hypothetical protein
MKHRLSICSIVALLASLAVSLASADEPAQIALMPQTTDFTHMWWAEGFPSHTPSAPWRRCIQTGRYAMVLDTETLHVPHFGSVARDLDYATSTEASKQAWQSLPPADLTLAIVANGKLYRCTAGGPWTNFTGPRLIESGCFVQRADVTDLVFTAEDGSRLNVEARFETVAWPDRLSLVFAARPGLAPIPAGEACFGRLGGGFGLDGTNHLEIPHNPELDTEQFTLEFWAFVPTDYQVSKRAAPWLVCKNHHEQTEGNYGIILRGGVPRAMMNIGGGRDNAFFVDAPRSAAVRKNAWNHLAISYDGQSLRLYVNGETAGEKQIGRRRVPGRYGLAFGRRQDNSGDGYYFRGAVDEIGICDRALTAAEMRQRAKQPQVDHPAVKPVRQWRFRADGQAATARSREQWQDATMGIRLKTGDDVFAQRRELGELDAADAVEWPAVTLAMSFPGPGGCTAADTTPRVTVQASEVLTGAACSVDYDAARGWHRVNLDGIVPVGPPGDEGNANDVIERVRLMLTNPDSEERVARLLFEKSARGIRVRLGSPITGVSAVLRDRDGNPTGIPVQLSKNWHTRPEGGVYAGVWFHGISQVRLPPGANVQLELTIVYAHWGGVAAASHAQLCLIGWGSNQLWTQSALGAWGESICYEPDQVQADCSITDVRPLMVRSMSRDMPWNWTHNVGGGDFFRLFDADGSRVFPARMRTAFHRQGPCLTEVTYAGHTGSAVEHSVTVSLGRTDDVVRGTYRLRMDVNQAMEFSRLVLFQIGADTYSYTGERRMAVGDAVGLTREWNTQWGGDTYRTQPMECSGRVPWISLHDAVSRANAEAASPGHTNAQGAWANRGIVIRSWNARLAGERARPWIAERGVRARDEDTSTIDVLPPQDVHRLQPGDFVEATIEHIVMPQFASDYYGPNNSLRAALGQWENTWHMIHREATGNDRHVEVVTGTLRSRYPAVRILAAGDRVEFTITGGLGYVPITMAGLTSHRGFALHLDGQQVNQSIHGNDYWQTDYDPATRTWEMTFNLPLGGERPHNVRFGPAS